jgi:hypothetical protein
LIRYSKQTLLLSREEMMVKKNKQRAVTVRVIEREKERPLRVALLSSRTK